MILFAQDKRYPKKHSSINFNSIINLSLPFPAMISSFVHFVLVYTLLLVFLFFLSVCVFVSSCLILFLPFVFLYFLLLWIFAFSYACISSLSVFLFLISSLGQTCFLFCTSVYFFVHILSIFQVCLFLFSLSFPRYLFLFLHCLCQPFSRLVQMTEKRWPNLTL